MGNSLQDQLFKAGLANKKQAVRAKKASQKNAIAKSRGEAVEDETAERVRQSDAEKNARDRELNRKKQAAADQKAILAQSRQLVEHSEIGERGDVEYRFDHAGTIKTLLLQAVHRKAVINGQLAIVSLDNNYHLVPRHVAEKIAERDASLVVTQNAQSEEDIDDTYAGYEVPDDLMW